MSDYTAHPLFLNENSDEPPEVGYIHLVRWESGRKIQFPKQFSAEELTGLDQIQEQFGGGNYELIARNFDNTKITDRRRIMLPGKPKPFIVEPEESEDEDEPTRQPQAGAMVPPAFAADSIMGMFMHSMTMQMQMMQNANEASRNAMQNANEASRNAAAEQTKMMIALMSQQNQNQPKSETTEMLKVFAPILMQVVTTLLANKGNAIDQVLKTMEVMNGIKEGAAEGKTASAGDDWQSLIKSFMAGMAGAPGGIPSGMHPAFQQAPQQAMPRPRRRIVEVPPPEQRRQRPRPIPEPEPEPAGPPPGNSENNTQ